MAKTTKKKVTGGGKLTRTQTVTIRLDPKLRYLAELAARTQRRTVSSFIEWAIEESLHQIAFEDSYGNTSTLAGEAFQLWDVDEPDRFVKLVFQHPHLLTHEEQILWKLIKENGNFWKCSLDFAEDKQHAGEWKWDVTLGSINIEKLREHWETLKSVANSNRNRDALPKWEKYTEATPF